MNCDASAERLRQYLEGNLAPEEMRQMQHHVERCETCQSRETVPAALATLLRRRLEEEPAAAAFRARLQQSLQPGGASEAGWQKWLASPWMPRLAMALVLAFLLLVPLRGLFQAPLLAREAVRSHVLHVPTCDGPLPGCCTDLALHVGAVLPEPAAGCVIPDLRARGLELVVAARCTAGVEVVRLCYRDVRGDLFSLYITDRVAEEFQALHPRTVQGLPQERYRVESSEVTLWEQGGFVHFWIGPRGISQAPEDLALLRRPH